MRCATTDSLTATKMPGCSHQPLPFRGRDGSINASKVLPDQTLQVPIGFVHLPKTAGTMVQEQVTCPDLRCNGHGATAIMRQAVGMPAVMILREPVARFVSAFVYAIDGSEFHKGAVHFDRSDKFTSDFRRFSTAGAFVDALRDPSAPLHRNVTRAVKLREGGLQFRPMVGWLERAKLSQVSFVCYAEAADVLGARLQRALRTLGSPCVVPALRTINRSGRFDGKAPGGTRAVEATATALTHEQAAWVREQYSADVELFEAVCGADGDGSGARDGDNHKAAAALPECVCSCGPCKRPMGIDDRTESRPPPMRPVRSLPAAARAPAARSYKIGARPGR